MWDSLGKTNSNTLEWIKEAIEYWLLEYCNLEVECQLEQPTHKKLQKDASNNCGLFLILFAFKLSSGLDRISILTKTLCEDASRLRKQILDIYFLSEIK